METIKNISFFHVPLKQNTAMLSGPAVLLMSRTKHGPRPGLYQVLTGVWEAALFLSLHVFFYLLLAFLGEMHFKIAQNIRARTI